MQGVPGSSPGASTRNSNTYYPNVILKIALWLSLKMMGMFSQPQPQFLIPNGAGIDACSMSGKR
jgi:hypothetical protein